MSDSDRRLLLESLNDVIFLRRQVSPTEHEQQLARQLLKTRWRHLMPVEDRMETLSRLLPSTLELITEGDPGQAAGHDFYITVVVDSLVQDGSVERAVLSLLDVGRQWPVGRAVSNSVMDALRQHFALGVVSAVEDGSASQAVGQSSAQGRVLLSRPQNNAVAGNLPIAASLGVFDSTWPQPPTFTVESLQQGQQGDFALPSNAASIIRVLREAIHQWTALSILSIEQDSRPPPCRSLCELAMRFQRVLLASQLQPSNNAATAFSAAVTAVYTAFLVDRVLVLTHSLRQAVNGGRSEEDLATTVIPGLLEGLPFRLLPELLGALMELASNVPLVAKALLVHVFQPLSDLVTAFDQLSYLLPGLSSALKLQSEPPTTGLLAAWLPLADLMRLTASLLPTCVRICLHETRGALGLPALASTLRLQLESSLVFQQGYGRATSDSRHSPAPATGTSKATVLAADLESSDTLQSQRNHPVGGVAGMVSSAADGEVPVFVSDGQEPPIAGGKSGDFPTISTSTTAPTNGGTIRTGMSASLRALFAGAAQEVGADSDVRCAQLTDLISTYAPKVTKVLPLPASHPSWLAAAIVWATILHQLGSGALLDSLDSPEALNDLRLLQPLRAAMKMPAQLMKMRQGKLQRDWYYRE